MKAVGVGQRELARLLDVSPSTVGRWLKGTSGIEGETLVRLCHVLRTSTTFLMGPHYAFREEDRDPLEGIIKEMIAVGLENESGVLAAILRVPVHQRLQIIERMRGMVDGFLAAQQPTPPSGHHGPNGGPMKPRIIK